jgi:hypothetical protein
MVFPEEKRSFIEELRALDESAKQKVLVGATMVLMVVVLYFWLAYFNTIVSRSSPQATASAEASTTVVSATGTSDGGFGNVVSDGFGSLIQFFKNESRSIGGVVNGPREYEVSPR